MDRIDGVPERRARRQVERDGDCRELPLMADGKRRRGLAGTNERRERDLVARGGANVNLVERLRLLHELGLGLEDDAIQVELREDRRDLTLAEGIVERVVDGLRSDP